MRAFEEALEIWGGAISTVAARDFRPHVVVCCLPPDVLDRCRVVDVKLTSQQKKAIKRRREEIASGQTSLLDLDPENWIADEIDADTEQMTTRNLRRALKAASMAANTPIQIATKDLWDDEGRNQDAATRAWIVSVALFYKASGIPWRMRTRIKGTCFVGISFHHRRTTQRHFVYSSLAQAFSSEGDGFAIRGDAVPRDDEHVQPRMTREQLPAVEGPHRLSRVRRPRSLARCRPQDFELHTGRTRRDQRCTRLSSGDGASDAATGEFRMLHEGVYPPHRGTYCAINDAAFLFTSGYVPAYRTYPGPHVPAPLELVADLGIDSEAAAADILALTKMNWNSGSAFMRFPITLNFAQKVGAVMGEVPPDVEPHPSLRYYM
jgi:hypothetical protein